MEERPFRATSLPTEMNWALARPLLRPARRALRARVIPALGPHHHFAVALGLGFDVNLPKSVASLGLVGLYPIVY